MKNVIWDCPKQCDVGVFDFLDDYRKNLLLNLKDGEKSSEIYDGQTR